MFDLIEESLLLKEEKKKQEIPQTDTGHATVPVSVMPEKFRLKLKTSSKKPLVIGGALAAIFLVIGSMVAVLFLFSNQKPPPTLTAEVQQSTSTPLEEEQQKTSLTEATSTLQQPSSEATTTSLEAASSSGVSLSQEGGSLASLPGEFLAAGKDSDNDGLTDTEEYIFATDPKKPDTDADQYSDGDEVKNLYNPLAQGSIRLDETSIVHTYENKMYRYRFFYPSSWAAQATNQSEREVVASSATGEFFSFVVEENQKKLNASEWYAIRSGALLGGQEPEALSSDGWKGVISSDGLVAYITEADVQGMVLTPFMYVLRYDTNKAKTIEYLTTFRMIIKSFTLSK